MVDRQAWTRSAHSTGSRIARLDNGRVNERIRDGGSSSALAPLIQFPHFTLPKNLPASANSTATFTPWLQRFQQIQQRLPRPLLSRQLSSAIFAMRTPGTQTPATRTNQTQVGGASHQRGKGSPRPRRGRSAGNLARLQTSWETC